MSELAPAWKHKAKLQRWIMKRQYQREAEWLHALRLSGIGKMGDLNPDTIRLTITVPSEERINEIVEERVKARRETLIEKILDRGEWIGWDTIYCYWCDNTQHEGHAPECLYKALTDGR